MEKIVAAPASRQIFTVTKMISYLWDSLIRLYYNKKCQNIKYKDLTKSAVFVVENILQAHNHKNNFYKYINFSMEIKTENGWIIDINKCFTSIEESIVVLLYKNEPHGQTTFSIVFENKNGKINGIERMAQGFCFGSNFCDEECGTLNPNVLASLLRAKRHLCFGTISELKMSNEPISFGRNHFEENDLIK